VLTGAFTDGDGGLLLLVRGSVLSQLLAGRGLLHGVRNPRPGIGGDPHECGFFRSYEDRIGADCSGDGFQP
jgi:hypothetical protein